MEVSLIPKLHSKKTSSTIVKGANVFFKPSRRLRKLTISKPYQQRLEINAYSPINYFKDRIADVFNEMRSIYGNIPLWVNYFMFPSTVSWNLGSVQAVHSLLVYGEEPLAKEFISRFNEIIRNDESNIANGINILSHNARDEVQSLTKVSQDMQYLPAAIREKVGNMTLQSRLLGASGLIAGLAGIALALSFFSNRRSRNSQRCVSRQVALKTAINSVSELMPTPPVLENEEYTGNCWRFKLSDYVVTVDSKGVVTEIRRVEEND
jgi:hypothetical protein